jgi:two-component system, cell cycle sensor histidine kinase and response regulator CckA
LPLLIIVILSIITQLAVAFLAIRLIKVTGHRIAWILIAAAMILQASRRIITLFDIVDDTIIDSQVLLSESIGLLLSILMLIGVAYIKPFFEAIRTSIIAQKEAEEGLRESNRELRTISSCNRTIIRTTDEQAILNKICDIICDIAGYRFTWVGMLELNETKSIDIVACKGIDIEYITDKNMSWKCSEEQENIIEKAILDNKIFTVQDIDKTDICSPCLEIAKGQNCKSVIILPLSDRDEVFGVLGIYGTNTDAFTPAETRMLEELAGDLAFGLSDLHHRAERTRIEAELEQSEQNFRNSLDNSPVGICVVTEDEELVYANKVILDIYGYRNFEELKNTPVKQLYTAESYEEHQRRKELRESGGYTPSNYEIAIKRKDGQIRYLDTNRKEVLWNGENCFQIIYQDITQQKIYRQAWRDSEERFHRAIDNIPAIVVIYDADLRIQYINSALFKITGIPAASCIGVKCGELFPAGFYDKYLPMIEESFSTGNTVSLDSEVNFPGNNKTFNMSANCIPIKNDDGRVYEILSIIHDYTEQEQIKQEKDKLESQLMQAQKMEAVGRLAGGIAHDFNNLLTIILGYCQMLLSKKEQGMPDYNEINEIKKAGDRAAALTRQLLTFSRKQPSYKYNININETITNMTTMLRRVIGENIELITELDNELGNIKADPGQMEQIIMNMVINSRDAMPKGGKLYIKTQMMHLDKLLNKYYPDMKEGDYINIIIEDTGNGIDKEVMKHIFEPFYTTKGEGKGTGLGLSVVFGIIKNHGGKVEVYSETGKGTVFKIYLPSISEGTDTITHNEIQTDKLRGEGELILVVEDEEPVRNLVRTILEDNNYRVLTAASAKDGLELFKNNNDKIDLIFSDITLTDMNGAAMVKEVAKQNSDIKYILSSGYVYNSKQILEGLEDKLNYIQKPYNVYDLLKTVNEKLYS